MNPTVRVLSVDLQQRDDVTATYDVAIERGDISRSYRFVVAIDHSLSPGERFLSCSPPREAFDDFADYRAPGDVAIDDVPFLWRIAELVIEAEIVAAEGGVGGVYPVVVFPERQ
jgi:hypothetical protein